MFQGVIRAKLIHKPSKSDFDVKPCLIEKWIPISHYKFEKIMDEPLQELDVFKEYQDLMYSDNECNHCIMLLEEGCEDGILVKAEGYDYPRYACLVPNARAIYEETFVTYSEWELRSMIRKAVDRAIELAHSNQTDRLEFDSLIRFDCIGDIIKEIIVQRLENREDVLSAELVTQGDYKSPYMYIDLKTKPLKEIKFYCPLKIEQLAEEDEWDVNSFDLEDLSSYCVTNVERDINRVIKKYASSCEENRGIMAYLDDREQLGKVYSIFPSVKKMDNALWGVFECKVYEDLDSYELEALRSELSGQASDGWGEGFEQQEIQTDDCGKLYVSFYGAPNWSMKTEEEMGIPANEVQDLDDGDISM